MRRGTAAVFALALAARLAFWVLADQPLLYTHQYHYYSSAIRIAEHPTPVAYVIGSAEVPAGALHVAGCDAHREEPFQPQGDSLIVANR